MKDEDVFEKYKDLPKTHKEASEKGETFYFTGKPCPKGHTEKRYAKSRGCVTCSQLRNINYKLTSDYWSLRESNTEPQNYFPKTRKEAREKGLKYYFTGKPCKYGHVDKRHSSDSACDTCAKLKTKSDERKNYLKGYYKENSDKIKKNGKRNYKLNPEKYCAKMRERRAANPTPSICRSILSRVLKYTYQLKDNKTCDMLGYDSEKLKQNIEDKFLEGMSWDNYGDWHIDHIYPVSRYVDEGVTDPAVINSLDNLMPMWKEHNLEKDTRTLEEYLEVREDLSVLYGNFIEGGVNGGY